MSFFLPASGEGARGDAQVSGDAQVLGKVTDVG
jgi:hypothetical protein